MSLLQYRFLLTRAGNRNITPSTTSKHRHSRLCIHTPTRTTTTSPTILTLHIPNTRTSDGSRTRITSTHTSSMALLNPRRTSLGHLWLSLHNRTGSL